MRRFFFLNLLCIGILQLVTAQNAIKEQAFLKDYEGTINGKLPVKMHLVNWGGGNLSGNYLYKKVGKKIDIYGEFTSDNAFNIKEYVGDKHTGTFEGAFEGRDKIKGTWSDPKGIKKFPFEVNLIKSVADNSGWAGNWYLNDIWDSGTLLIGNVRKDSLDFAISVFRAGHIGEVEGTAARKGNQSSFSQRINDIDDAGKCAINFTLKGSAIEIEQVSSGWDCGFGMRAHASGKFDNKKIELKPKISYGADQIFANKAQHDGFLALVGQKMYELFAFNMQGFEKQTQEAGDGFKATVVVGAASGLFMTNEAIILYDGRGKYWAATLDFVGDQGLVRYFSNDATFKKKLPPTIEHWRERFPEYEVSL